jgi:membrane associated rhomboid family serine protease
MFLHGGGMHLFGNVLALLVFGIILERRIGSARFLAIYFLAHFAAAMFDTVIRMGSWESAYGASAAIAGIAGACFVRFSTAKAPLGFLLFLISSWIALTLILVMPIRAMYALYLLISIGLPVATFLMAPLTTAPLWPFVLIWMLFQVGYGVFATTLGIIAAGLWAHISGFFTGMVLSLLLTRGLGEKAKPREEIPAIG